MSATMNPQDPFRDLPVTDDPAFKGPVRVQDILTFTKAMDFFHVPVDERPQITPQMFTRKEIGLAHFVATEMNNQIANLGLKVVDNHDATRVPSAYLKIQASLLYRSLIEGDAAANRGSWFKIGYYVFLVIALIEAYVIFWPK